MLHSSILDLISWFFGVWEFWLPVLTFFIGLGMGSSGASEQHNEQLERLVKNVEYPKSWRKSEINIPLDGSPVNKQGMADSGLLIRIDQAHGSGVCISSQGLVITNAHVVGESKIVEVEDTKFSFLAPVIKKDEERDVAALFVANAGLKPVSASLNPVEVGDEIYISGAPHRVENKNLLTRGVVSKVGNFDGLMYIHTDASIAPGNSGGPAFNANGELVGISVAIQRRTDNNDLSHIGLVIPISEILSSLKIQKT
ncbi:MAG: S1C family serine protease [Opitutaceae bacterium]